MPLLLVCLLSSMQVLLSLLVAAVTPHASPRRSRPRSSPGTSRSTAPSTSPTAGHRPTASPTRQSSRGTVHPRPGQAAAGYGEPPGQRARLMGPHASSPLDHTSFQPYPEPSIPPTYIESRGGVFALDTNSESHPERARRVQLARGEGRGRVHLVREGGGRQVSPRATSTIAARGAGAASRSRRVEGSKATAAGVFCTGLRSAATSSASWTHGARRRTAPAS